NAAIDTIRSGPFQQNQKTDSLPDYVDDHRAFRQTDADRDPGLAKVVDLLDPNHRSIIELLYFQQYTQSEAAEKLNLPLGTVKTRTRNALSTLRQLLAGEKMMVFVIAKLLTLMQFTLGS